MISAEGASSSMFGPFPWGDEFGSSPGSPVRISPCSLTWDGDSIVILVIQQLPIGWLLNLKSRAHHSCLQPRRQPEPSQEQWGLPVGTRQRMELDHLFETQKILSQERCAKVGSMKPAGGRRAPPRGVVHQSLRPGASLDPFAGRARRRCSSQQGGTPPSSATTPSLV